MNYACYRCRGESDPPEGAQRLGLCEVHLAERVRNLMAQVGKPAQCSDTYY